MPANNGSSLSQAFRKGLARVYAITASEGLGSYIRVMALGSGARMFGLASQFVVLILLGKILSKDGFGEMMIAFGFYRVIATALGVGGSLVLLYHVSRRPDDRTSEIRLHRFGALLVSAIALAIGAGIALGATSIAAYFEKPGLAQWLQLLAPFCLFNTLLVVATGALEGRSKISESILVGDVVPSAVRIVLLPAVALLGLGNAAVAHILTISVLVPWLWAARSLWSSEVSGVKRWTEWDYAYGGKFTAATLFANQLGAIDLVVAGMLFPATVVADYAVASRIAALYTFFQLIILKRFAPQAGQMLAVDDKEGLRQALDVSRRLTIGCTAMTIAGLLLVSSPVLAVFGNFASAKTYLALLAVPSFVSSFYASSDRLLLIAGKANVLLTLTVSSFLVLITTPFVTHHWLGLWSIPFAMILSAICLSPIISVNVRKLIGAATIRPVDVAAMACGVSALVLDAYYQTMMMSVAACIVLAGIAAVYLLSTIKNARLASDPAPA